MILAILVLTLIATGVIAWLAGALAHRYPAAPRWVSLAGLGCASVLVGKLLVQAYRQPGVGSPDAWIEELRLPWIPSLGISVHLGADGLSLVLIGLSLFLGVLAVGCSWKEIQERTGFFHLNLLWILAGIVGVFVCLDLFLFYFFWELMLIPMYFLISIWGHENRAYASVKFFIFTQASGLLMLVSILALYFTHAHQTGLATFDYPELLGTQLSPTAGVLVMLGFFIAFAVKLPMFPFHTWLPDAHTEAPTAGSVILAGLLLKTGAYGMIRFVRPLFPEASALLAPVIIPLTVIGILYGAWLAFAQTDLKRLVAYTSVSHLGFVLLGIFSGNPIALQGAMLEMVCHGLSTGALFILVGAVQERLHTRDLRKMGGFWALAPRMGGMVLFFSLASLGLPGLGNFVSEFLILLGSFREVPWATGFATTGLVFATIYSLWIVQRGFHGSPRPGLLLSDLGPREMAVNLSMVVALLWIGLAPQSLLTVLGATTKVVAHVSW